MERRGRVDLILGPMFAGKTTELMRRLRRYKHANLKTFVIAQKGSDRYAVEEERGPAEDSAPRDMISSHDRMSLPADFLVDGTSLISSLGKKTQWIGYDVIAIDEGQFFYDLYEFSKLCISKNKTVIVAALNGDFLGNPWESVSRLIPLCQSIGLLSAVCNRCHEDNAILSSRTPNCSDDNRILIGGSDLYVPLCVTCREVVESMRGRS